MNALPRRGMRPYLIVTRTDFFLWLYVVYARDAQQATSRMVLSSANERVVYALPVSDLTAKPLPVEIRSLVADEVLQTLKGEKK